MLNRTISRVAGADFATWLSDPGAASYYAQQASEIEAVLPQFFHQSDESRGPYIAASVNVTDSHGKKTWLDTGTLLGVLHGRYGGLADEMVRDTQEKIVESMR